MWDVEVGDIDKDFWGDVAVVLFMFERILLLWLIYKVKL